ncbi:MAG: hypothetical protein ABIN55_10295 [Aeromicrobium sp.]
MGDCAGSAGLTGDVRHQCETVTVELLGGDPLCCDAATLCVGDEVTLTVVDFLLCDEFGDHVFSLSEVLLT